MRVKYKCNRCGIVVMNASQCEIDVESTETDATLIVEDCYDDGGYIEVRGMTMVEALMLQDELFRTGMLDVTGHTVVEVDPNTED